MSGTNAAGTYSAAFYDEQRDLSRRSAEVVVPMVLDLLRPGSVVDVGCGVGTWLSVFRRNGIDDVLGLDGDYVDRSMLEIPADRFRAADLSQPLALDRRFDLVVSLEVAEHIPAAQSATFVRSLTGLGPVVLFSAAIPRQGGTSHVNEQWPSYWVERFAAEGYRCLDVLRRRLWDRDEVGVEYVQNTMVFADRERADAVAAAADPGRHDLGHLPLVHPRLWQAQFEPPDPRTQSFRANAESLWGSLRGAARSAVALPGSANRALARRRAARAKP